MNDLIVIEQLPIIKAALAVKSAEIEAKTQEALSMICTDDTVKTVKTLRADLNKEFSELESQRKAVKDAVMAPYEEFEALYKDLISSKFKNADAELKGKISEVESGLKAEKEKEIKAYYDEYAESVHLLGYPYERSGINVTLTASEKSLKEQCRAFCDRVLSDLALIRTQTYASEIELEYRDSLNVSSAIRTVIDRHVKITEVEKAAIEIADIVAKDNEKEFLLSTHLIAPKEVVPEKQMLTVSFTITDTKDRLLVLRKFLKDGGYKYE